MEVTAGVPQGAVLGPTLWNIAYVVILECEYSENTEAMAFADDLCLVALANDEEKLMKIVKEGVWVISR